MLSLAEKAALRRAEKLEALLDSKKKTGITVELSLSCPAPEVVFPNEVYKNPQQIAPQSHNNVKSDDAQSIKRSASSESEDTVEIKPGIRIPRPTKELSLEELIAIAKCFGDPNAPQVVTMTITADGRTTKRFLDGSYTETIRAQHVAEPFDQEHQALINWYRNEGPLPLAPFYRTTGVVTPHGKYDTTIVLDHAMHYQLIDVWISQGSQGGVAKAGLLKEELQHLKKLGSIEVEKLKSSKLRVQIPSRTNDSITGNVITPSSSVSSNVGRKRAWTDEEKELIKFFTENRKRFPTKPFNLKLGENHELRISDTEMFYEGLSKQIAKGPSFERAQSGCLQRDLEKLRAYMSGKD